MRALVGPVPEPAERAGSALRRCPVATIALDGRPALHPSVAHETAASREGRAFRHGRSARPAATPTVPLVHQIPDTADLWVALPIADAAAIPFGGTPARLEVLDQIIGGAARGRIRRVVVVEGLVEAPGVRAQRRAAADIAADLPDSVLLGVGADTALVRLRATRILLTDHDGVTDIAPDDLATTGPDPFTDLEGHWLEHLNDPRCQVVQRIAMRVCRCLPAQRPMLVGIDRAGVDLEIAGRDDEIIRQRLPFAEACTDVRGLGTQLRLLAGDSRYPLDRAALRP